MTVTVTVRVSDQAGNETIALHDFEMVPVGQVYEIDALTAPWNNQATGATADQTASIKAQIAAIPDGVPGAPNIIRFPVGKSQGKYFTQGDLANNARGINGAVLFRNRHHLIIEGPSPTDPATFYTVSPAVPYGAQISLNQQSERRHFWFQGCTNITLRNIRVEGSNYTMALSLANGSPPFWLGGPDSGGTSKTRGYKDCWEAEHAFAFDGCDSIVFEDCQGSDIWGDGLYLGSYGVKGTTNFHGGPEEHVNETSLQFIGMGRQGIALSRCADVKILDFTLGSAGVLNRRAGLDLEPVLTWIVERVEIGHFRVYMGNMTGIAARGSYKVDDINIHDGMYAPYGTGGKVDCQASDGTFRKNWTLRNLTFPAFGSPLAAAVFARTDNILIDNCTIPTVTSQSRVVARFARCQNTVLKDSECAGGLWVEYGFGSSVPQLSGNTPVLTLRAV